VKTSVVKSCIITPQAFTVVGGRVKVVAVVFATVVTVVLGVIVEGVVLCETVVVGTYVEPSSSKPVSMVIINTALTANNMTTATMCNLLLRGDCREPPGVPVVGTCPSILKLLDFLTGIQAPQNTSEEHWYGMLILFLQCSSGSSFIGVFPPGTSCAPCFSKDMALLDFNSTDRVHGAYFLVNLG